MRIPSGTLVAALLALALAEPSAADGPAEPPPRPVQFTLGARISAALPMGSVLSDPQTGPLLIGELVALSIPLQLDAGVTLGGKWFVGGYVQYGWNVLQIGQCKVGETCQLTGLRVGAQALFSFQERGDTPWVGVGTGYEWLFTRYSSAAFTTTLDVGGWEFANVQAGYDVVVSPGWKVGPWVSASVGEFSRATLGYAGQTSGSNIPNKAIHGWFQLGVKGSFSL
jgi:outer membrane protein